MLVPQNRNSTVMALHMLMLPVRPISLMKKIRQILPVGIRGTILITILLIIHRYLIMKTGLSITVDLPNGIRCSVFGRLILQGNLKVMAMSIILKILTIILICGNSLLRRREASPQPVPSGAGCSFLFYARTVCLFCLWGCPCLWQPLFLFGCFKENEGVPE